MILVAILFEDNKAVRAWRDSKCLYNAYKWAHHHYCLADEGYSVNKLPDWLKVELYMTTEEKFQEIVK